jgi:hypothetical protein
MARCKTTVRKQVMKVQPLKHPETDWMLDRPEESHNEGNIVGYFPRKLRSLLNALDYHDEPLYLGKKTPNMKQRLQVGCARGPLRQDHGYRVGPCLSCAAHLCSESHLRGGYLRCCSPGADGSLLFSYSSAHVVPSLPEQGVGQLIGLCT